MGSSSDSASDSGACSGFRAGAEGADGQGSVHEPGKGLGADEREHGTIKGEARGKADDQYGEVNAIETVTCPVAPAG